MTPAPPLAPDRPLIPWALSFMRPYRGRVALLALLVLVQIALGALEPWTLKVVVDYVLSDHAIPAPYGPWILATLGDSRLTWLIVFVLAGVVLQIVNQFATAYGMQIQVDTGQRMVYDLRYRLFAHIESLGLNHHITTSTGDAVYRIDVDSYSLENLVLSGVFPLVTSFITLLVMFGFLLKLDVTIALLSLTVIPFLFLSLRYYASTLSAQEERVKELESSLISHLYETFTAIRLVKSFAREDYESARYKASGQKTMQARIDVTWQQALFGVAVAAITILGTALVVIVGGLHVMRGTLTVGSIFVVINYLGAVYGPLSAIAHTTGQLQGAVAGARRVRAMLALTPETVEQPNAIDATAIEGHVCFDNVSFSYPDGTEVLREISFQADPGEMVALVGLTGAGKTTLVSLIPRFYDATSGAVRIDGRDVHDYHIRSLREKIAIVPQDAVLFSGTIAENLRYGRLDASDEDVENAAKAAHAHDFVARLPKKYDTKVAEAGGGFSGGERQRLSVARAILKNAPVLILDEPTSSLDAISEEIVFAALRRLRAGRTTIVIAHRLSTVRDADQILVLDGGRIVAHGRHEALLQTSSLYRRMCARLSVGKSLDEPETVDELLHAAKEPVS
ncbi:MAG: ABC transporter ATP-binding protein/permease [Acidobacteriaceae bacterium]|jgi:ATP-binding cassette subfamily B protein/subfamily B ATP-binding cassette protein MsbA|nr:ABC transporter ATP-binding protein/permease [Acidobacteriaceae bacterium]